MFLTTLCLLFSGLLFSSPESSPQNKQQEHVLEWAKEHLPQTGVLKEQEKGFVYLKIDDNFINQLFPMLSNENYSKPPYFRRSNSPGAHISVIYVDEHQKIGKIKEIGETFSFKLTEIARVPQKSHEYIVIKVDSPDLEKLREKYGLTPLLKGHSFHITLAKKMSN